MVLQAEIPAGDLAAQAVSVGIQVGLADALPVHLPMGSSVARPQISAVVRPICRLEAEAPADLMDLARPVDLVAPAAAAPLSCC